MHSRRGGGTTLSEPFDFGLSSEPKRARRCAAPRPAGPGRSDSGRAADLAPHRAKQNEQGNPARMGPDPLPRGHHYLSPSISAFLLNRNARADALRRAQPGLAEIE